MCIHHRSIAGFVLLIALLSTAQAASPLATCDQTGVAEGKYCLLSEVGGCAALPSILKEKLVVNGGIYTGTLIVDQTCELDESLVLPRRMTLAGVGIGGEGSLTFPQLKFGESALSIQDSENPESGVDVTIRDISIYGPGSELSDGKVGIGLDLLNDSQVILERVRIADFDIGVRGYRSFSVSIAHSNISNNHVNLHLRRLANTWRVRDSILSQASDWSVLIRASNGALFDGNRFESNWQGGIDVDSDYVLMSNNRFEQNGGGNSNEGIRIGPESLDARVVTNIFSASTLTDAGVGTHCLFNALDPSPLFLFTC